MRGRTIFLVASFAFPIIATPVPTDHIEARESIVESRSDFSIAQLYRDLSKREPLVEALPEQASYVVADKIRRITTETSIEASKDEELTDKRSVKNPGGGPTKRVADATEADMEKRRMKSPGGGPTKRGRTKNPGGV
ncbi:hypothetical protein B0T12DRAFT_7298 [Alternaria alternata]|nr:hypothetical protein B0T12DRAFT_7298 [Alternaria alternata]